MFPAEVSSSCVSEQQHMDHCSCIHTLIYTANRAFKSQPHLEHPCFELPASVTPLVTDHSHTEMSPKGFLVAPQLHLPVRPPKVPQGLRSNSCSDKHESLCNFYEGIKSFLKPAFQGAWEIPALLEGGLQHSQGRADASGCRLNCCYSPHSEGLPRTWNHQDLCARPAFL